MKKFKRMLAVLLSIMLMMTSMISPSTTVYAATETQSIVLNVKSKVTMYVGTSKKIKVTDVVPQGGSKQVIYESSEPSVVKMSNNGTMKALAEGTATITITSVSNEKAVQKVNVTVKNLVKNKTYNKMVIPLDKKNKTRKLSRTSKVKSSYLLLSSSRKKVATVSKAGVLTGKKVGTTKITIKGKKGLVKGAKQVITLYVAKKSVETVALDKTSVTLKPGDPIKLATSVTPSNAANVVVFTSSDEDVAVVDQNGNVKAVEEGIAEISATTVDGNKKAVCVVTVSKDIANKTPEATTEKENGGVTTEKENNGATTEKENGGATTEKENTGTTTEKENGGATTEKENSGATTEKENGGATTEKENSGATTEKESSGATTEKENNGATTEKENSGATTEKENSGATTEKENGGATTEKENSGATTEKENSEATTEKETTEETTEVPGEVSSVSLNKTSATIDYGAAVVLKATVSPEDAADKTITWKSENTRVATVADTGVVVGAGEGTTVITATTSNGKTASCTITVVEKDVDSLFVVPYVSTYYFNPKPSVNEDIKIPIYMTDSNQSEYLNNDTTGKLDLIYGIDDEEKVITDLPLGDYTVNLGKLSEGIHTFTLQTLDKRTGMKSHKLYNELWVVNPETYEISESQTYHMTEADLEKYQIHNDNSTDETDLITTRDGLTKMFADLQGAGYRKCILLPGTYRINGKKARDNCISIPSNFTVDMNQSTFKLDTITDDSDGCIVRMYETYDAHLTNGTLEGDRFERKELGLETGGQGEQINTLLMRGGKYSSISNLTFKNTTGHTVGTGYIWGPSYTMTEFTQTAIIDGKEVEREGCSTSSFMDLTKIIDWDPNEDYMYVGHGEGYRGIKGNSSVVYVHFYDENKNFLETVTGYQFRKMKIVDGAKYARVTLLGNFPSTYYSDSISIFAKHLGDYYEIKDIDFVDTRTTAMAPSACNNLLIEGCTYTRAGNSITPCAVDFEDGWEECQDVYYRNNKVLVESGTATVIDCAGFNHVYENLEGHRLVGVRDRVLGGVFRNVNDTKTNLQWTIGTKKQTAFGRIYDNTCGNINFAMSDRAFSVPAKYKVKNCTINGYYVASVPNRVIYENCTFPTFSGSKGTFKNCTIQPTSYLGNELYFYDCTFKNLAGDGETVNFRFNVPADADRVFENCTFEGKTEFLNNNNFHSAVFRNCEFDDLSMTVGVDTVQSSILFEKCKIHSTADNFIYVGPFGYSYNYISLIFKECDITHTGQNLIYLMAKPNNNSQILFEDSTVNKSAGALLMGGNLKGAPEDTSIDIIFRNSTVNKELAVDENAKPEQIRITYE